MTASVTSHHPLLSGAHPAQDGDTTHMTLINKLDKTRLNVTPRHGVALPAIRPPNLPHPFFLPSA